MSKNDYVDLLFWGSARDELKACPDDVQSAVGIALWTAQTGKLASNAKPFGEGGAKLKGVMKVVVDSADTNTYRAAYVTKFEEAVYVLAVFEKKSASGAATPKVDIERVAERFSALRRERDTPNGRLEIERLKQVRAARQARAGTEVRHVQHSSKPRRR